MIIYIMIKTKTKHLGKDVLLKEWSILFIKWIWPYSIEWKGTGKKHDSGEIERYTEINASEVRNV